MTLIRFEPVRGFENFNDRIHQFFSDLPDLHHEQLNSFDPKIDIFEDEKNIFLEAEVPGVSKDDIKISLEDNILTISGEKKQAVSDEKENVKIYRKERCYGIFTRKFTISKDINVDNVEAEFKNGILKISIGKAEAKKVNNRVIEVK